MASGSGTVGSTGTPTVHKSLVAPPAKFDGKKENYENFLRQLRLYVLGNATLLPDDTSKVITALSFFEGGYATTWATAVTDAALSHDPPKWEMWKVFLEGMEEQFGKSTKQNDAITEIENLYQKGMTAEEYWIHLKALVIRGKIDIDKDWKFLKRIITTRMNKPLIRQVYAAETIPTDFNEWEKKTTAYDRAWRECNAILEAHGQKTAEKPKKPTWVPPAATKPATSENVPMDVDKKNTTPQSQPRKFFARLTDVERAQFMQEGRCFRCRELGHRSSDKEFHPDYKPPQKAGIRSMQTIPAPAHTDDKDALIAQLMDKVSLLEKSLADRQGF